jgi:hypothetical protein
LTLALIALVLVGVYLIDPTFFGLMPLRQGFTTATLGTDSNSSKEAGEEDEPGVSQEAAVRKALHSMGGDAKTADGFADVVPRSKFMGGNPNVDPSGNTVEDFANMEDVTGPAQFSSASAPAGCYPRDQLTPGELLPKDANSVWAQQNPMGTGSLKGKNFLSAGALIGVNTVGQTLRNANYQLRSEPANPQVPISVFNNSTIEPDTNRRDLEID